MLYFNKLKMSINEENILNNNFCFSKVLKDIDFKLKFKDYREEKSLYILRQLQKEQREKRILFERRKNHNEIVHSLHKANEENQIILDYKARKLNKNLSQINLYSTKNSFFLPKLKNKEEQKNKDNKVVIFEKIWKEQYLNKNKKYFGKRNKSNKTMYSNNNLNDIFDVNYDKMKKKIEKKTQQKILLERIKINNLKVKKKLKIHQDIMSKFKDKREYIPNYNAIEKHLPEVNFNTKSQRIFPIKFIKINNVGELNSTENRSESVLKKSFRKDNSYKSLFLNNVSTCTLFKNIRNNNENSFIKEVENKNRSII